MAPKAKKSKQPDAKKKAKKPKEALDVKGRATPPQIKSSSSSDEGKSAKSKKKASRGNSPQTTTAPYIDENGKIRHDADDEKKHFENHPRLQAMSGMLVMIGCLPKDPNDMFKTKHRLLMMQWLALLCDVASAVVAVVTFSDVTYCCGEPILDIVSSFPWKTVIRMATYLYLVMIVLEIYPVIQKGFPFNIVNPLFGFLITFAMFFDDSKNQALIMWSIESMAIICEFILYRLKVHQTNAKEKELKEMRKAKEQVKLEEGGDKTELEKVCEVILEANERAKYGQKPATPVQEVKDALRDEEIQQENNKLLLWYLGLGCYMNILLALVVLALVLAIASSGGLCVADFDLPNPFNLDQLSSCPLCEGSSGVCEVCTEESTQCFYPYS